MYISPIEVEMLIRILLSALLGAIIGFERQLSERPAGLRTHMLVSIGATIFTMLSITGFPGADPARVASYVVMGIGFIGAGTVLQTKDKVVGLTTAASLWLMASIGMLVGTGFYLLAVITTVLVFVILSMRIIKYKFLSTKK